MDSLGALYSRLTNELQLINDSQGQVDVTCNLLRYVPDLQSVLARFSPTGSFTYSIELSKLSIVKLFLELNLLVPKSATVVKAFNDVFKPGFLDFLISQYRLVDRLPVVHIIAELSALLLFSACVLDATDHFNNQTIAVYLNQQCLTINMKIRVVNALCKLQKKYKNEYFTGILSDVFGTLIWNHDVISRMTKDGMFFVKLCTDVLSTNAVNLIRPMMFQDFQCFFNFFSVVEDVDLQSCVCIFLNELFPYHGCEHQGRSVMKSAAEHAMNVLQNTDYALLHGVDVPAACVAVLRISLWVLEERCSLGSHEKCLTEHVFTMFERFKITGEEMIRLCIEEDKELIDFLLLHLDLSWIAYKQGISDISYPLVMIKPWDLFIELMLKLSFDESVLNDWLISNETYFLRYFVKLCKMVRLFWREFNLTCSKMSEIQCVQEILSLLQNVTLFEACMSALIRLKLKIVRLHEAQLYPYSPKPLIKLLTSLEDLYERGEHLS